MKRFNKMLINNNLNKLKIALQRFFAKLLDAVYPPRVACIFCDREAIVDEWGVCKSCASKLTVIDSCKNIIDAVPELDGMKACFKYTDEVANAIKRFKYKKCSYLGKDFAAFMEIDESWDIDFVIPVPLHIKRQRKRGYNQCKKLAEPICERYGFVLNTTALVRVLNTQKQATKTTSERLHNLEHAFSADENICRGKSILIIDDVCTTGSTLHECAAELKRKGAKKVYALVFSLSRV